MRFTLSEHNIVLIDFQDIHKKFEKDLIDDIHSNELLSTFKEKNFQNKDIKKLFFHHSIKGIVEYINKINSHNKVVLYFNNTQLFTRKGLLKFVNQVVS